MANKQKTGPKPRSETMRATYIRLPLEIYSQAERLAKIRFVDVSDVLREWILRGIQVNSGVE